MAGKIENVTAGGNIVLNPGGKSVLNLTCESTNTQIRLEDGEVNLPKLSITVTQPGQVHWPESRWDSLYITFWKMKLRSKSILESTVKRLVSWN